MLVSAFVCMAVDMGNTVLTSPHRCLPYEFMVHPHIWFPDTPGESEIQIVLLGFLIPIFLFF